jgi:gamma-glutamylcysteine synthetase
VAQAVLLLLLVATLSTPSLQAQPTTLDMNLSTELVQAILNYLAQRPYAEVFQLINAVQAEAQAAKANAPTEE